MFVADLVCAHANKTPNGENLRRTYLACHLQCCVLLTRIQNILKSNICSRKLIMLINDKLAYY